MKLMMLVLTFTLFIVGSAGFAQADEFEVGDRVLIPLDIISFLAVRSRVSEKLADGRVLLAGRARELGFRSPIGLSKYQPAINGEYTFIPNMAQKVLGYTQHTFHIGEIVLAEKGGATQKARIADLTADGWVSLDQLSYVGLSKISPLPSDDDE